MPSYQKIAEKILQENPEILGLAALRLRASEDKNAEVVNSLNGMLHSSINKAIRGYPEDVHGTVAAMARRVAKEGDIPGTAIEAAFGKIGYMLETPEQLKWKESDQAKRERPPKSYEKAVDEIVKAELMGKEVRPILIDTVNFNFPTRKPLLREKYGSHSWDPERKEEQRTDY